MSVTTIMARVLDQELQARGIFSLSIQDCEEIIARVIEMTAEFARASEKTQPEEK